MPQTPSGRECGDSVSASLGSLNAFRRIKRIGQVDVDRKTRLLKFAGKGTARVVPDQPPASTEVFTVEAVVTPSRLRKYQYILESQDPPVRLALDPDGTVVGSVHTKKGWESVTSGDRKLRSKETASLRLLRRETGEVALEINDRHAGSARLDGHIAVLGKKGITVGGDVSGRSKLFHGTVGGVRLRGAVFDAVTTDEIEQRSHQLASGLKASLGFAGNLEVILDSGTVDARFEPIKAILAAAGVDDVSALSTLTINQPTVINPNQIIIAPPKTTAPTVDWGQVANVIATADVDVAIGTTASVLFNRNSQKALLNLIGSEAKLKKSASAKKKKKGNPSDSAKTGVAETVRSLLAHAPQEHGLGQKAARSFALQAAGKPFREASNFLLGELIKPAAGLEIVDPNVLTGFAGDNPAAWPAISPPLFFLTSITTIPVDTSVIIAGRLDLTNQTLMIEPDVKTLYIIAEELVGDTNASISWRRPGGSTPGRLSDPDKNGRSYSGVYTASNSRNGLPGGDGGPGDPGFAAAHGVDAPNLEVWVKNLTAMPDIDLNGEDGIKGGRGQAGGRGGRGAKGQTGKWWWFFGVRCWEDPGHGGDGGDGGHGGRGGRGGDGGHGGEVAIGVLTGTLASTVQARAFKIKNQGGQPGRGGDGGPGGLGGNGGPHGNDWKDGELVCGTGRNGSDGAQGQPGAVGADGRAGGDGSLRFFEFTEESWDEQLTRPWLYELTPSEAFPGDEVIVTGTRFADTDRVFVDGMSLTTTINADESISFTLPEGISGGEKDLYVRRHDGDESNHLRLWVKPRLDLLPAVIPPGSEVALSGRAFLTGAKVLYNGLLTDATVDSPTTLRFTVPGTGGTNVAETEVRISVRNPDGMVSNERVATVPRTLDSGFRIGVHDYAFANFAAGDPSWGTFEDTFGAFEVWHQLLDPIFGHPILTPLFYAFYHYFLLGEDNGGLATGFCTSLSTIVLDEYYTGSTDTHSRYVLDESTRERFTAIHGRLLSRESLIDFHDQGRRGTANVETCFRRIEASLRDGADRNSALMLFFVPSGAAWDGGYFDRLGDSHCIVPIRMVYPAGHDGSSIPGVTMFCWDCNHPVEDGEAVARNCRLEFRDVGGEIRFSYFDGGATPRFRSEDGITLATMSNGKYYLSDHDLPFSGPLGLTRFVVDFLLSPADLLVQDGSGRRTGLEGGAIVAEIPDSHPAYLAKNLYLLPADQALTRRIRGNGSGSYAFHSVAPNGTSISLENVPTVAGEEDELAVNSDASQLRFIPGAAKSCRFNLAREMGGEVRAVSIEGLRASPVASADMTLSPDLSVIRVGNQEAAANVNVRVTVYEKESGANTTLDRNNVSLPVDHDLMVTVTDWADLALTVRALPFAE